MKKKIGLALGGGAARGLAHLGVLDALHKANISIDLLTGTSMGALIAGLYCANGGNIEKVFDLANTFLHSRVFRRMKIDFLKERNETSESGIFNNFSNFIKKGFLFSSSMTKRSFVSEEVFESLINDLIDDVLIEKLPIPFAAVATSITSGKPVLLNRGSLRQAILASTALPGVFPPVFLNGNELVDGGLLSNVPVDAARYLGADIVIAVDVSATIDDTADLRTGLHILFRGHEITRAVLNRMQAERADVIIRPDVGHVHWANFGKFDLCIEKGREALKGQTNAIHAVLEETWLKKLYHYLHLLRKWLTREEKSSKEQTIFSFVS